MRTRDVDGAWARAPATAPDPSTRCFFSPHDIDGARPMTLHRNMVNKPDLTLFHDDIEGTRSRRHFVHKSRRHVDPLEPDYPLPSYQLAPAPEPKFIRDGHNISDIEGAVPRPLYPRNPPRDSHSVGDVVGASVGWKPRYARARLEAPPHGYTLDVRDITGAAFRTGRHTDTMAPSYTVYGMHIADDPERSRPRRLPRARDSPFYPLTTADIEGAQPGWKPPMLLNPPLESRRQFHNTNYVGDIEGAQPDTVKHAMRTQRRVNPLCPVYVGLGGEKLEPPQSPRYKDP
ncbi:unnamed protein product, partial [Phaeothamnion confervicola]